ncbi:type III pantothenate kinase [Spirosoma sp. SC4-14]|uniref:type III pantothenate kinase n=1 Tax=Spirosoma sp. SC4-14 TaxID=3128900 RepID=UPI0030D20E2F
MNLVIDWGNSSLKVGWFDDDTLLETRHYEKVQDLMAELALRNTTNKSLAHILVSSTSRSATDIQAQLIRADCEVWVLDSGSPVPIYKDYDTPHTLGTDRIAAAVGATALFPEQDCLVIDLGTCMTADLVVSGTVFRGGLISPGLRMRFRAMHEQTARLPLVDLAEDWPVLTARTTRDAMQSGVMNGMLFEINGLIDQYRLEYPNLVILVCGGDAPVFESRLKQPIFAVPELVLVGLNRILRYNVENLHADKPGTMY